MRAFSLLHVVKLMCSLIQCLHFPPKRDNIKNVGCVARPSVPVGTWTCFVSFSGMGVTMV